MEEIKIKRTVKKLFLRADKVRKGVKRAGGVVMLIGSVVLKSKLDSINRNGDNE